MLIEITTFRLADGADENAFLDADSRIQTEFIPNLPGFVRRTTARGEEWLVVTLWGSESDALAAEELALTDPVVRVFDALVDASTVRTARYTTLD